MNEILLLIAVFFSGYVLGWLGHAKAFLNRVIADPDEMIKLLNDYKRTAKKEPAEPTSNPNAREVEVEQVNGQFYLYAKDNGEFLAQAESLDEALKKIEQRFPGQCFQGLISSEEAKRMGLSN